MRTVLLTHLEEDRECVMRHLSAVRASPGMEDTGGRRDEPSLPRATSQPVQR